MTAISTEAKRLPKGIWRIDLPEWTGMDANGYIKLVSSMFVDRLKESDTDRPDYVVTRDCNPCGDWSDLVFSNQNFFDAQINDALAKAGLKLKVRGISGGGAQGIKEGIRREFPDYNSEIYVAGHYVLARGCLYRVVRES